MKIIIYILSANNGSLWREPREQNTMGETAEWILEVGVMAGEVAENASKLISVIASVVLMARRVRARRYGNEMDAIYEEDSEISLQ